MISGSGEGNHSRRSVLRRAGVAGIVGLAGCVWSDDEVVLLDENDETVELSVVYANHTSVLEVAARSMGQDLEANLGIAVEMVPVPTTSLVQQYMQQSDGDQPIGFNAGGRDEYTSEREWDFLWGVRFNTFPRSPQSVADLWTTGGEMNFFGYEPDAAIGEMLLEAGRASTVEDRREGFAEAFGVLSEELPANFVQFEKDTQGYQDAVVHTEEPSLEGFGWGHKFQTWRFEDGSDETTYSTDAGGEAQSLSIYQINDDISGRLAEAVLDGAYTFSPDETFQGRWIESVQDDGDVFEFHLRDNLYWSDPYGQMTADDWVFFVDNVVTHTDDDGEPDNWTGHVWFGEWWEGDEPIRAERVDELTFRLELPETNHTFVYEPTMWGTWILPRALTEPYFEDYLDGDDDAGANLHDDDVVRGFEYTGNLGPYTFVERRLEDRTLFERNDEYYMRDHGGEEWAEAPYFEEYVVDVIYEEATRLAQLEVGNLSNATLPADEAGRFEEMDDVQVVSNAAPDCTLFVFNQRANGWEPLRTTEVRQALAYSIDKNAIVADIYQGNSQIAQTFQPEWSAYFDDSMVTRYGEGDSYDPEHGRDLLEQHLPGEYGFE